ncbi:uncharacterized protein [Physcomitrium patens]|uniref:Uncharacterized protein n=1 Tax=Physcomitrium patens TaxID=3218 RepID=A0A7I4CKW0_PHYPA|nr:uncharacterized protein LOC112275642 [Physcomitrium patens]|eukprot:XP_024361952.1 uncharacterized protein LOC112275642 [Physcomitrella patens]
MATGIDVGQLQRKVDELQSKIETYELQRKVDVDRLQSEVDRLRIDVGADPRLSEVDVDQLEREAERATSNDAPLKERNNYEKIKALLWIKDQRTPPVYREALEEWDKKSIVVASSIERKTKQVESLKNEIYNLVGFYSVFQGVVFTAVAQGNEHFFTCSKCFIAIVLSILASVVSFVGVWQKHQKIQYLEDKLEEDHVYKKIIYGPPKTNPSAPATLYWDGEPRNLQSDQNLITLLRNWMAKFFRPSLKHDERPDVEVPVEDKSEPSSAMPHPVGPGSTT